MMRKLLLLSLVAIGCQSTGCTYVEPGYAGIKVNMYGNQKGVEDFPVQTGRVWYNPWTEDIYTYPTFMQNIAWTDDREQNEGMNQAITFNSMEGAQITANIGMSYTMDAAKVPNNFIKFRRPIEEITATYLRTKVRDAFNRTGGGFKAVEIFGERKQELLDGVKKVLDDELADDGFQIDTVSFIGSPVAEARVMESINQVITATQQAIQAENKVRQVEAEAKQKIAEAEGEALSILRVAQSQAEANLKLSESITPALIQYRMLEKWDGVAPRVMGGDSGLLLSLPLEPQKAAVK